MSLIIYQRDLLRLLISNEIQSYNELENKLGISKRSLKLVKDSLVINSHKNGFSIKEKGNNLQLEIYDKKEYEEFFSSQLITSANLNSFHKRQATILETLLDSDSYISAEDLADELFISRRTLTRDLKKIKKSIAAYQLIIHSKAGTGLKILGSEFNKRLLYLYEVIDFLPITREIPADIQSVYKGMSNLEHFPFEVEQILQKTISITLKRKNLSFEDGELSQFTENSFVPSLMDELYSSFNRWIGRELSAEERKFIAFPLYLGILPKQIENESISKVMTDVLKDVDTEFNLELNLEEYIELLNTHFVYIVNRSFAKYTFTDISLRKKIVRNSFAFAISKFIIDEMVEKLDIWIHSSEILLLSTWIEVLLAKKNSPLIKRIAVITQGGASFIQLIREEMLNFFTKDVELVFYDTSNRPSYEELDSIYDLVFVDNLIYSSELLQPFYSLTVLEKENRIDHEKMEKRVMGKHLEQACKILTVDFNNNRNYEESLVDLLIYLQKQKLIDKDFMDHLLTKEDANLSLSSEGLAFPHYINKADRQIILVVQEKTNLRMESEKGFQINDFVLICVPAVLNENSQNILIKVFDSIFRSKNEEIVYDRLGIEYVKERTQICLH